ncbi:MAG: NTP transferase domain-containing protein [Rhizobiaceae bacterium]
MTAPTAIILAAGRGLRMGPRGVLTPKGLLTLGGETLVGRSIATLRRRGVEKIRIVTGHLSDAYEAAAAAWGAGVELRYNPLYAERGSLHSLLVGMEDEAGSCMVLESDMIYEPRALDFPFAETSWLTLSGPTGAGDEVYVWTAGPARLLDMSKKAAHRPEPHRGELVGVLYLSREEARLMREVGARVVADAPKADYEAGLVALAAQATIECPRIGDLAWAEIDDEAMLKNAEGVMRRIEGASAA